VDSIVIVAVLPIPVPVPALEPTTGPFASPLLGLITTYCFRIMINYNEYLYIYSFFMVETNGENFSNYKCMTKEKHKRSQYTWSTIKLY